MEKKDFSALQPILALFDLPCEFTSAVPFRAEEDGAEYSVWKLQGRNTAVLKKTCIEEQQVYTAFFSVPCSAVPQVYGFREYKGQTYLLMEYVPGETLSRCTRQKLIPALDALIATQERFWEDRSHEDVGYNYLKYLTSREKRLPYMGDLTPAYESYLQEFRRLPRTLCNDDLLPFNVLVDGQRAVILDWEYAGILPYPCALARLLAFGEEDEGEMFQMSLEDRQFALEYYYQKLLRSKGIGWEEFLHSMRLFFLKEYSEWVYCANSSGEDSPYFSKYGKMARALAREMGML